MGKTQGSYFICHIWKMGDSVNSGTPKNLCQVKYPDFDEAIRRCMDELENYAYMDLQRIYLGKSDFTSAFRNLGMNKVTSS